MATLSIRLDDEIINQVKDRADSDGVTAAELYREYIEKGLRTSSPKPAETNEPSLTEIAGIKSLLENQSIVTLKELFVVKHALHCLLTANPKGAELWAKAEAAAAADLDNFVA